MARPRSPWSLMAPHLVFVCVSSFDAITFHQHTNDDSASVTYCMWSWRRGKDKHLWFTTDFFSGSTQWTRERDRASLDPIEIQCERIEKERRIPPLSSPSFFFQWSRFKIMTEECRDYQCRCASLGSSGCRGDREKLFSMVMSPSQALLGSLRGSWCSVNDLFVNSAHVFLIRSVATSILSNYLLFQWEKRRGETTTTRVHVLSSKLFFILLAPFFFFKTLKPHLGFHLRV